MEDKRVKENKENLLNLIIFLKDVCTNVSKYKDDVDLNKILSNQKLLASYKNEEFKIKSTSLNTLKRTSEKLLESGFNELDNLRLVALKTLTEYSDVNSEKAWSKQALKNKNNNLEKNIDNHIKNSMLCMSQIMETIVTLKNINNTKDINLIHLQSNELLKKLIMIASSNDEFIKNINIPISFKVVKGTESE